MRVLYIGNFLDGTGWSRASIDYILSLDAAGVDVACRPIKLNNDFHEPPARIRELMSRPSSGAAVVIQHTLPHNYDYNGRLKNIGLYASETSNFRQSTWPERLNCMDAVWVINKQMEQAARASGVSRPIAVIPHATDVERFQRSYQPLESLKHLRQSGSFVFYTIGEMTRRKNVAALIRAFHAEFDPSEPVELVVKCHRPGMSPEECRRHVEGDCEKIRAGMKLYARDHYYKRPVIVTERLTDEAVLRLHHSCDCFVQPSYGEAWSILAFDAMACGKTPIVTACTGYLDYLSDETGWLVNCHEEPVFNATNTFDDLFTSRENWWSADINHLRVCMREAYEKDSLRQDKARKGIERTYCFSYDRIGALMKSALIEIEGGSWQRSVAG